MNYVIIGNSAAAAGAIGGIRKVDPTGEISLFSQEPYQIYSRPLISYYLANKVNNQQMYYRPEDYYQQNNVTAYLGEEVVKINVKEKEVVSANNRLVKYDKLLLATGGKPILPKIPGMDKENVHSFLQWDQAKEIKKKMEPGKKVVILGAGLIGLKAAEGLVEAGCQVTVVDLADRVLSAILDDKAASLVQQHLEKHGISFNLSNTISEIHGDDYVKKVSLQDGAEIDCELVILAIGVVPNAKLADEAGIALDRGILTDEYMETSQAGIFAAGDVAQGLDLLTGEQRVLPLWPNAYRQGDVAGINMAGGKASFGGGIPMNAIGFFGFSILTAGSHTPMAEDWEVIERIDQEKSALQKILLHENKLKGFIFLNTNDRAGIYNWLLEEQHDVTPFKDMLLQPEFGYAQLPTSLRQEKLAVGGETR